MSAPRPRPTAHAVLLVAPHPNDLETARLPPSLSPARVTKDSTPGCLASLGLGVCWRAPLPGPPCHQRGLLLWVSPHLSPPHLFPSLLPPPPPLPSPSPLSPPLPSSCPQRLSVRHRGPAWGEPCSSWGASWCPSEQAWGIPAWQSRGTCRWAPNGGATCPGLSPSRLWATVPPSSEVVGGGAGKQARPEGPSSGCDLASLGSSSCVAGP